MNTDGFKYIVDFVEGELEKNKNKLLRVSEEDLYRYQGRAKSLQMLLNKLSAWAEKAEEEGV